MRPIIQKPIIFKNEAGCLVDTSALEEAILWYSEHPVISIKKIFMYGNYPAISIGKKKIHVHRLLMCFWNNRILDSVENIHHINENKLDSTRENLTIIMHGEHQSYHGKNKILTDEHKKKISERNRLRKGIPHRKKRADISGSEIKEYLQLGYSILKISKIFKCDWSTIRQRIHENPELLNTK